MLRLIIMIWAILIMVMIVPNEAELVVPLNESSPQQSPAEWSRMNSELIAIKLNLQGVTAELEKFHGFYINNMETKILQIFTTMTNLDANLKALQERAYVWDIFKHHIDAWSDHMKSVDKKIDLIKRTQDTAFTVEAKTLTIYEKVDTINEKMHDMLKILYNHKVQRMCDPPEEHKSLKDIKSKVTTIEKQITLIQNNHCKNTPPRRLRNYQEPEPVSYTSSINETSNKDLKQIIAFNKKNLRNMEYLTDSINYINETTGRLHRAVDLHYTQISKCCGDNEARIAGLTDSVEAAFQKLERIYLNLEKNIKPIPSNGGEDYPGTIIDFESPRSRGEEDDDKEVIGSGSGDEEGGQEKNNQWKNQTEVIRKQTLLHCHDMHNGQNGIYQFGFNNDRKDRRYCLFQRDGEPGWTVIQRRGDFGLPRESFNRSWNDYKEGFGDLDKQFWLGNDLIHQLTNDYGQMELKVELDDFRGNRGVVKYNRFYIGPERSFYRLDIHGFDGNVSDSLLYHNGMYFSTYDSVNDHSGQIPCGVSHGSGWWFNNCLESNLNGRYFENPFNNSFVGIVWEHWLGDYSLKGTTMMIRPAPSQSAGLWMDDDEDEESPLSPPEDP